jgi:LruC domain-containing protein
MRKVVLFAAVITLFVSCVKDIEVRGSQPGSENGEANSFDFSTVQNINLSVDYSAYHAQTPVLFSVYSENPFNGSDESMSLREDIRPVFEAYTDRDGKFNDEVKLPAYAKKLYVVTGNFFITDPLMTADVKSGSVSLVAENYSSSADASRRAARRAGELTNSLETLYQLSYEVNVATGDKTDTQIYKEWQTPLGKWDRESGRPDYLMDKSTADPRLLFTEEETQGLYETVTNALAANKTCNPKYLSPADLVLVKESEVALSFLGGVTCWNNTLGYYYYDEAHKPASTKDVNIIMLFPNTQDGTWSRSWMSNPNFYGNIALERGDVVKLMYYPNIANGDLSGATTKFPKGTRIGFIMKSNGWGMQKTQGDKKFFNSYNGGPNRKEMPLSRQYNVWGASTDGLSYCNTEGLNPNDCKIQNPDGLSRTAKFAYESPEGKEYAIIGFEDACNDEDFDDVIIALKPADVFQELPKIEEKKVSSTGVYGFEDLWPSRGDYDLNDALVEVTHEKTFSVKTETTDYKIFQETFYLTTDQNYVELQSGLALTLKTKENPSSIIMKKVNPATKDTTEAHFVLDGNTYLLTDNIKAELGTTYILELNYELPGLEKISNVAEIKPFIYRTEGTGRWEVHIPFETPTSKMITSYFGTMDDKSVPSEGKYFVRNGNYPFAFYLEGANLDNFKETLLLRSNESVKIDELYPSFLPWVLSNGTEHADWYLYPRE